MSRHARARSAACDYPLLVVGHANCLRALVACIQPIGDDALSTLGLPNGIPLVYDFSADGEPRMDVDGRCYVPPLAAHYLGEACEVFNRLDVDGSGGLDLSEIEEIDGCRASFDAMDAECALSPHRPGALRSAAAFGDCVRRLRRRLPPLPAAALPYALHAARSNRPLCPSSSAARIAVAMAWSMWTSCVTHAVRRC